MIHGLLHTGSRRAHDDNHAFGILGTLIIVEVVLAAGDGGKAVHGVLHDGRKGIVEGVAGLAGLEEQVRVLRSATDKGMLRRQCPLAAGLYQPGIDQCLQLLGTDHLNRTDLVTGTKAIEKMQYRYPAFQRCHLGNTGQIHHFLGVAGGQQGEPGGPGGHHITVITEDRQGMGRYRARCYMKHRRRQFTGDLEHVGDFQQQPLGGGEGAGLGTGLKGAVNGSGGTGFTLQFDHLRHGAPEVAPTAIAPTVGKLTHHRCRGDRIDGDDIIELVRDGGGCLVTVHHPCF